MWANLLWRDPVNWQQRWRRLDDPRRLAAISELLPDAAEQMTGAAVAELLDSCNTAPAHLSTRIATPAAAFAAVLHLDPQEWVSKAPPAGILDLVRWRRSVVSDGTLTDMVSTLREGVEQRQREALEGKFGLGGGDVLVMIGKAIAALGKPDPSAETLLLAIAGDARMAVDDQLAALQGISLLQEADLLSDPGRARLRQLDTSPGVQIFGSVQVGALRAAQLYALGAGLTSGEQAEVFAGCRSSSEQVRLISIAALETILSSHEGDPGASWTLLSALYDPSDDVLSRALDVLARNVTAVDRQARQAATGAVASAYRGGRHIVRLAAIQAAIALADDTPEGDAQLLVEAAAKDPSWEVRRQATRSP